MRADAVVNLQVTVADRQLQPVAVGDQHRAGAAAVPEDGGQSRRGVLTAAHVPAVLASPAVEAVRRRALGRMSCSLAHSLMAMSGRRPERLDDRRPLPLGVQMQSWTVARHDAGHPVVKPRVGGRGRTVMRSMANLGVAELGGRQKCR